MKIGRRLIGGTLAVFSLIVAAAAWKLGSSVPAAWRAYEWPLEQSGSFLTSSAQRVAYSGEYTVAIQLDRSIGDKDAECLLGTAKPDPAVNPTLPRSDCGSDTPQLSIKWVLLEDGHAYDKGGRGNNNDADYGPKTITRILGYVQARHGHLYQFIGIVSPANSKFRAANPKITMQLTENPATGAAITGLFYTLALVSFLSSIALSALALRTR